MTDWKFSEIPIRHVFMLSSCGVSNSYLRLADVFHGDSPTLFVKNQGVLKVNKILLTSSGFPRYPADVWRVFRVAENCPER